ncbi:MAG: response regulator [Anaerolineae bacterium]
MAGIRVLVADGHKWVRQGLREILESSDEFSVVAEAENGFQVLDLCKQHQPDVVILDMHIPGLGGIEAAKAIKHRIVGAKVIVLTSNEDYGNVMAHVLLSHDVDGYLVKTCELVDLQDAVRNVNQGHKVYRPSLGCSIKANEAGSQG